MSIDGQLQRQCYRSRQIAVQDWLGDSAPADMIVRSQYLDRQVTVHWGPRTGSDPAVRSIVVRWIVRDFRACGLSGLTICLWSFLVLTKCLASAQDQKDSCCNEWSRLLHLTLPILFAILFGSRSDALSTCLLCSAASSERVSASSVT